MWITRKRAAELMECSTQTVDRLIEIGELTPRKGQGRQEGSLDQEQVLEVGQRRRDEQEARTKASIERERQKRRIEPPDTEHEWLTASQAARVIGMSPMGVYKRIQRGTIPYTDHAGRHWFRRDLIELLGNARSRPPKPEPVTRLAAVKLAATPE